MSEPNLDKLIFEPQPPGTEGPPFLVEVESLYGPESAYLVYLRTEAEALKMIEKFWCEYYGQDSEQAKSIRSGQWGDLRGEIEDTPNRTLFRESEFENKNYPFQVLFYGNHSVPTQKAKDVLVKLGVIQ